MSATDQLLIQRILEGDEEAIRRAYLDCRNTCIAFLRRQFTYTAEVAAEIYNDAFVEMWRNTLTGKLVELSNSLSAYLNGIAHNMAQEKLRTEQRHSKILEKIGETMPSSTPAGIELEEEEERQRVQALLGRLGDRCRQLLVMHYFLHFDDHAVAEDLGIPYDRVRKERHKCLAKARGEMDQIERI
ncbi:MAG: sigma-70 family RNA polymerase sigma factor [Bacteroidia bacterium]